MTRPRKPLKLLPPKPGRRRYWTVQLRLTSRKTLQRSTRSPHRTAAQEFALALLRQEAPQLTHLLDQPRPQPAPRLS